MGSRALGRRMYTSLFVRGKGERYAGCLRFSDQRQVFLPDGFSFQNVIGLLVEKAGSA